MVSQIHVCAHTSSPSAKACLAISTASLPFLVTYALTSLSVLAMSSSGICANLC